MIFTTLANFVNIDNCLVRLFASFLQTIDLFGLHILFSQYRSWANTQELQSFVLFIKKSACRHIHACMRSF